MKTENPCPPLKYVAKKSHFSPTSQHFNDMSTLRPSQYYNVIFLASICSQFHYKVYVQPTHFGQFSFCRADELTRRKMMSAASASNSVPGPQHGWNGLNGGSGGLNGTISTSGTKGGTSSPARKISPPNYTMKNAADETDPGQLLNEWLGELDNLQKVPTKHSIVFFFSILFSQCDHFRC